MRVPDCEKLYAFARECQLAAGVFVTAAEPSDVLKAVANVLEAVPDIATVDTVPIVAAVLAGLGRHVWDYAGQPRCPTTALESALTSLLASRFQAGLTFRQLAARLGVSSRYLSTLVRMGTDRGFLDHLHALRIVHAAWQLQDARKPIRQVAAEFGYRRRSHFHRHFSARLHITPRRFRRLCAVSRSAEAASKRE